MSSIQVKFKRLHTNAKLPSYATSGSAGMDCYLPVSYPPISQGEIRIIPLGFSVEIPEGYEIQVRPRSGLASRGLVVANSPGTIDSDYRGEVGVILWSAGGIFALNKGERICQLVLNKVPKCEWVVVDEIDMTDRGEGGFGSTGVNAGLTEEQIEILKGVM